MLLEPDASPEYDPRMPELAGVRWPSRVPQRVPVEGEVAMFDVADPGELQEW